MRILIYDKNTPKNGFITYGYGKLTKVISCNLTEELNGRYDVELEISNTDNKVKYITKWAILSINGQLFRIINIIKKDNEEVIKILANHIFYDINYGFSVDSRADKKTVAEAMYIALPDDFKTIYDVSSDIEDINSLYFVKNNGVESVFGIIDRWGKGELLRDNFSYAINNSKGKDNGVTFTYKKIEGIEITEDTTEVITRLYPTGKDGIALKEKYVTVPNWNYDDYLPFHITREVKFNDIDSEGTLRELAKKEAENIGLSKVNFKINVQDLLNTDLYKDVPNLLSVEVGDIVTVKHPKLDLRVKVKVIKKVSDLVNNKVAIELGQPFKSFFDSVDNGKVTVPTPDMSHLAEKLYYYSNGENVGIKEKEETICNLQYGVIEEVNLMLYFNAFITVNTPGTAYIKLVVNNSELDFKPVVDLEEGNRLISFTYPLIGVEENVMQNLNIKLSTEEGDFLISKGNLHVVIRGQNLSGSGGERPHAEIEEKLDLSVRSSNQDLNKGDNVIISLQKPMILSYNENKDLNIRHSTYGITIREEVVETVYNQGVVLDIYEKDYIYNKESLLIEKNIMSFRDKATTKPFILSENQLDTGVLYGVMLTDKGIYEEIVINEVREVE